MKDNSSKDILIKYFSTIKNHDNEIEELRKSLCNNKHFLPKNLFDSIDINLKSYLTLNDLRNYLNKNNIEFEEQCLRRFIHNFDKDEDFSIDYKEFLGIISPKKDDKLQNDIISKEPQENENNEIDSSSEKIFQEIIINEFNLIKDLYKIADELKKQKDFTTYETFLEIVKDEKYITKENLGVFLEDNNLELDDNDLDILLYRIDADNDGQISYQEFLEIFFPYRENYTSKDIKPEQERSKNYTIDDIQFKDENYEIPPLNEELKNSLYSNKLKYSNINPLNNNNINDNYLNSEINTNQPCRGITNKFTLSPLSNDYSMDKQFIIKKEENQENPTFSSTLNKSNQPIIVNNEPPVNQIDFDYTKKINKREPPQYKSYYMQKIQSMNEPIENKMNENIPRDISNKVVNSFFIRDPLFLDNRSEVLTQEKINDQFKDNNNYLTDQIPLKVCNRCHCPNPCNCYCPFDSNKTNLSCLLENLVKQNNIIEGHKDSLSLCTDVNLTDLFDFFDKSNMNCISNVDMKQTLIELGLCPSPTDINNIYDRYDKNKDNKLNYNEFCDMILPKKYNLAKVVSQRYPPSYFMGFSYDTKRILFRLFQSMIDTNKEINNCRIWLFSNKGFSGYDFYNLIKKNYANGITKDDIVGFMSENGKFLQPSEIALLMEILDKNKDGLISYNEFLSEIAPKY